jgi:hypothetical protein
MNTNTMATCLCVAVLGCAISLASGLVIADDEEVEICVSNAEELHAALATAGTNALSTRIKLAAGNYRGQFVYLGSTDGNLVIEGGYDASCGARMDSSPDGTLLDADLAGRVLTVSYADEITGGLQIDTLMLTQGLLTTPTPTRGGGLYVYASRQAPSAVIIRNTTFSQNTAQIGGGAFLWCGAQGDDCPVNLQIEDSQFLDNRSLRYGQGSAMLTYPVASVQVDNVLVARQEGYDFAGMVLAASGTTTLTHSTFIGNRLLGTSQSGAIGASVAGQEVVVSGNEFRGNEGPGAVLRVAHPRGTYAPSADIRDNAFIENGVLHQFAQEVLLYEDYSNGAAVVFIERNAFRGNAVTSYLYSGIHSGPLDFVRNELNNNRFGQVYLVEAAVFMGGFTNSFDFNLQGNVILDNRGRNTVRGALRIDGQGWDGQLFMANNTVGRTGIEEKDGEVFEVAIDVAGATLVNNLLESDALGSASFADRSLALLTQDPDTLIPYEVILQANAFNFSTASFGDGFVVDASNVHRPPFTQSMIRCGPCRTFASTQLVDRGVVVAGLHDIDHEGETRIQGPRPDIGARESPAHASLSTGTDATSATAQKFSAAVWDPTRGRHFSHVFAGSSTTPESRVSLTTGSVRAHLMVEDLNANGIEDVVSLEITAQGWVEAKVKDGSTGELLMRMPFEGAYQPLFMRSVPGGTGSGGTALAVLGINADGRPRAQVRDVLTGELVSRVFFDAAFQPFAFEVIGDIDDNGHPELAVVGVDETGRVRAQVKDILTGRAVSLVWFDRNFLPSQAVAIDTDGNGHADALAVLGETEAGMIRAQVKDVRTGAPLGLVRFESGWVPQKLVVLPDLDGGGTPELGVLQRDAEGRVRVQVKDAVNGQPVSLVPFPRTHAPRDLVVVSAASPTSSPGLVYLGEGPVGTYLLQLRDAKSGQLISSTVLQ